MESDDSMACSQRLSMISNQLSEDNEDKIDCFSFDLNTYKSWHKGTKNELQYKVREKSYNMIWQIYTKCITIIYC